MPDNCVTYVNASVDEHLVSGVDGAQQVVKADHRGIRQGELVVLRQTRTGLVLVEEVVLLGVVGHGVAAVAPGDVKLYVVLIVGVGTHLHELGACALQSLRHVLHLEVIQVVLDLHVLWVTGKQAKEFVLYQKIKSKKQNCERDMLIDNASY